MRRKRYNLRITKAMFQVNLRISRIINLQIILLI